MEYHLVLVVSAMGEEGEQWWMFGGFGWVNAGQRPFKLKGCGGLGLGMGLGGLD